MSHLPTIDKPLDVLDLNDTVRPPVPEIVQVGPAFVQSRPYSEKLIFIDIIMWTGFRAGASEQGMNVPAHHGYADGNGGETKGKCIASRSAAAVADVRETRLESREVFGGPGIDMSFSGLEDRGISCGLTEISYHRPSHL